LGQWGSVMRALLPAGRAGLHSRRRSIFTTEDTEHTESLQPPETPYCTRRRQLPARPTSGHAPRAWPDAILRQVRLTCPAGRVEALGLHLSLCQRVNIWLGVRNAAEERHDAVHQGEESEHDDEPPQYGSTGERRVEWARRNGKQGAQPFGKSQSHQAFENRREDAGGAFGGHSGDAMMRWSALDANGVPGVW
jgi:hypothetical protein